MCFKLHKLYLFFIKVIDLNLYERTLVEQSTYIETKYLDISIFNTESLIQPHFLRVNLFDFWFSKAIEIDGCCIMLY